MAEPQNFRAIEELRFKTGLKIEPRIGLHAKISQAIERLYTSLQPAAVQVASPPELLGMEFISSTAQERNVQAMREMQCELQRKSKTTPAVHLVATIIRDAAAKQASDNHIEPQHEEAYVRFRVDGVLRDYGRIPRALQNTVASRIKILSDMDIAERRVPQDGRFLVRIGPQRIVSAFLLCSRSTEKKSSSACLKAMHPSRNSPRWAFRRKSLANFTASSIFRKACFSSLVRPVPAKAPRSTPASPSSNSAALIALDPSTRQSIEREVALNAHPKKRHRSTSATRRTRGK